MKRSDSKNPQSQTISTRWKVTDYESVHCTKLVRSVTICVLYTIVDCNNLIKFTTCSNCRAERATQF